MVANLVSQNIFTQPSHYIFKSSSTSSILNSSQLPCVIALNSPSAFDQATTL